MRKYLLIIPILMVLFLPNAQAKGGDIDIYVDHDVADTYAQVLVIITAEPVRATNISYHIDRNLSVDVVLLDTHETVLTFEAPLRNGTVNFNLQVIPSWEEGPVEIRVFDPHTANTTTAHFKTEYSTDWAIWLNTQAIMESDIEPTMKKVDEKVAMSQTMNIVSFILVLVVVPIIVLKFEHIAARKHHESSIADRIRDRLPTILRASEWHYTVDPRYEFKRGGARHTEAARLRKGLNDLQVDLETMQNVEKQMLNEIEELEGEGPIAIDDSTTMDEV